MNHPALMRSKQDKFFSAASFFVCVGLCFYVGWHWSSLPGKIPTHFGLSGQADGWGNKVAIWLLPVMYMIMLVTTQLIQCFPQYINIPAFVREEDKGKAIALASELVAVIILQIGFLFSYIVYNMITTAQGAHSGLGSWFIGLVVLSTLVPIVLYLVRMKNLSKSRIAKSTSN